MQNLYKALATFRQNISAVKKDSDNPFYKSKYADLNSILEAIKDPLHTAGLALIHKNIRHDDGSYSLQTTIAHSESWESDSSIFPLFGSKPQEYGSSETYARRYNINALLDIPTEDDDGNIANTAKPLQSSNGKPAPKWLNYKELVRAIDGGTDTEILLTEWIKDNEYTLSADMKKCLRTYCDTGELVEPVWKK